MAESQHRALARLALRRVVGVQPLPAPGGTRIVTEPWPPSATPYSRTLWGAFLPERRSGRATPPSGIDRRRG